MTGIRSALVEKARCPKCSSQKCTVEALLPNLSLRQAIEHFLEAQGVNNALEGKKFQRAPGEKMLFLAVYRYDFKLSCQYHATNRLFES